MTRKEADERTAFENIIVAETTERGVINAWYYARLLCRHGKTYARIQELNCNGVGTYCNEPIERFNKRQARHEAWCEKREVQLEKRMRAIVAELGPGFGVVFSGDPRGSTVKVTVPSGRTNDWGHEGICVPTA